MKKLVTILLFLNVLGCTSLFPPNERERIARESELTSAAKTWCVLWMAQIDPAFKVNPDDLTIKIEHNEKYLDPPFMSARVNSAPEEVAPCPLDEFGMEFLENGYFSGFSRRIRKPDQPNNVYEFQIDHLDQKMAELKIRAVQLVKLIAPNDHLGLASDGAVTTDTLRPEYVLIFRKQIGNVAILEQFIRLSFDLEYMQLTSLINTTTTTYPLPEPRINIDEALQRARHLMLKDYSDCSNFTLTKSEIRAREYLDKKWDFRHLCPFYHFVFRADRPDGWQQYTDDGPQRYLDFEVNALTGKTFNTTPPNHSHSMMR